MKIVPGMCAAAVLGWAGLASAAGADPAAAADRLGSVLPLWSCLPFAGMLLSIALLPLLSRSNGESGIILGMVPQSTANVLDVSRGVKEELERVQQTLPPDVRLSKHRRFGLRERIDQ